MVLGTIILGDPIVAELAAKDPVPWYKKKNLRYLYLMMFPTLMGVEMTSGFDSSMMNGLQALKHWDEYFNSPRGSILGVMSAIYSLGAVCALPFIPFVSDRYGRRFTVVFASLIMCVGAIIQGLARNLGMFVAGRWMLGFGIPFAIVAASALIGELGYPKERAVLTSLFNASWFIGSIVAAAVTYGSFTLDSDWSWRIPSLLQLVPSLLQITFMYFIPESPRWLIAKDRGDEALKILIEYHAEGDENSEFVRAEYAQIHETLAIEMEISKQSWAEMFSTAGLRRRVLICSFLGLFTQWSGNGLISYYLVRILETVGITQKEKQLQINLGQTIWGFVNGTFMALMVYRFKRRHMYLACTISLCIVYSAITAASANYAQRPSTGAGVAVIFFIFLYSPCYNLAYNALTYTYLVELFPFATRARGITTFQLWGRIASFFNTFVNPIGLKNAGWKYYLSYVVWLLFEICFVYFIFPETSGRTLEELAFLFEDGDQVHRVEHVVEKNLGHGMRVETNDEEKSPQNVAATEVEGTSRPVEAPEPAAAKLG